MPAEGGREERPVGPEGADELRCPRCGRPHRPEERLCRDCRMPLVPGGGAEQHPLSAGHAEARKINPRLARGRLVRVAVGRNQAEAELIKGMLLEQGIPSMLSRTGGFDVPDFLAAGPRDVLVPQAGERAARELLTEADQAHGAAAPGEPGGGDEPAAASGLGPGPLVKLAALLLAALLLFGAVAGVVWWWAP